MLRFRLYLIERQERRQVYRQEIITKAGHAVERDDRNKTKLRFTENTGYLRILATTLDTCLPRYNTTARVTRTEFTNTKLLPRCCPSSSCLNIKHLTSIYKACTCIFTLTQTGIGYNQVTDSNESS